VVVWGEAERQGHLRTQCPLAPCVVLPLPAPAGVCILLLIRGHTSFISLQVSLENILTEGELGVVPD
jgi:hypothetical protein